MGDRIFLLATLASFMLALMGCAQPDPLKNPDISTEQTFVPGTPTSDASVSEIIPKNLREYLELTEAGWRLNLREETHSEANSSEGSGITTIARGIGWSPQRKIVEDSSGNLYATALKSSSCSGSNRRQTFVFKSTDGGASWIEPPSGGGPIACLRGHHQRVGSLAIDSQDRIHVVWYGSENAESEPNHRQVLYSKSSDGGRTWTDPKNISNTKFKTNEHPMLSVGTNDELYVTWDRNLFTRSLDQGETWDHWSQFSSTGGSSRTGSVVLSNGDIWVVRSGIDVVRSVDGGKTWTEQGRISRTDCDARHTSIVRDSKDNIHVVWRSFCNSDDTSQIDYSMYNGSSWSTPVPVSGNLRAFQFFPSITRDAHDNLYVAFIETEDYPLDMPDDGDNPTEGRIYVVANTGDGWGERHRVGDGDADLYPNWSSDDNILPGDSLYIAYVTGSSDPFEVKVATVVPLSSSDGDQTAANDLGGRWEFQKEVGKVAVDSSDYSNEGKLVGGAVWAEGRIGQAFRFNGQDDLIEIRTTQWDAGQGTVALWAKARDFTKTDGQSNYLFGHTTQPPYENRIQLYTHGPEGNLNLGLGDSHTVHGNIIKLATGVWYHIALTWDGSNYKVYVDGEQKAGGTYAGLATLSTTAHIGNNGGEGDEPFDGIIGDFRVYSYPLGQEEVRQVVASLPDGQPLTVHEGG
jgi:hypothetical protein